MDWIVPFHNSYDEALTHNGIVFGDEPFKEVTKVKWGPLPINTLDSVATQFLWILWILDILWNTYLIIYVLESLEEAMSQPL